MLFSAFSVSRNSQHNSSFHWSAKQTTLRLVHSRRTKLSWTELQATVNFPLVFRVFAKREEDQYLNIGLFSQFCRSSLVTSFFSLSLYGDFCVICEKLKFFPAKNFISTACLMLLKMPRVFINDAIYVVETSLIFVHTIEARRIRYMQFDCRISALYYNILIFTFFSSKIRQALCTYERRTVVCIVVT